MFKSKLTFPLKFVDFCRYVHITESIILIACDVREYGKDCSHTCSWNFLNGQACEPRDGSCLACAASYHGIKCDQGMASNQLICFVLKEVFMTKYNLCVLAENDNALYECHITFEILKLRPPIENAIYRIDRFILYKKCYKSYFLRGCLW